jgi:hypothetical protein
VFTTLLLLIIFLYFKLRASNNQFNKSLTEQSKLKEELINEIASKNDKSLELEKLTERFSDVFNKESFLAGINLKIEEQTSELEFLRESYREKKVIFDHLKNEAAIYDETIELAELGFYNSSFSFDHSEKYKEAITLTKSKSKKMLFDKKAVICDIKWTLDGSIVKGNTMTIRSIKLTTKAFNNECDSAISKVKWNNATRMIERINKAFIAINKLNEPNSIYILPEYLDLKIQELKLTHEYYEKKQQEKEEQAEIREIMREETRLEKELELSIKEEDKYQNLLDKAQKQAQQLSGEKLTLLEEKIVKLSADLEQAHNKSERAKSMAEQTKIGHVYVISNEGSFGKGIYKIGMTRRLEPLDRVKELGDASVPFLFDVHAMIYTENAPELEKSLHAEFNHRRLNLVNNRKEFFNVNLQEIEKAVQDKDIEAEFHLIAEARQYKESEAIREQQAELQEKTFEYPEAI